MYHRGFSLIELLVAMAIAAVIAGIGLPTYLYARNQARVTATRGLVATVASLVERTTPAWVSITHPTSGERISYRRFDWNRDGLVDGRPTLDEPGPVADLIEAAGFTGTSRVLGADLPQRALDNQERPIDTWGNPLRIAFAAKVYGATGFGVWSDGRDRINAGGATGSDDVVSWEQSP